MASAAYTFSNLLLSLLLLSLSPSPFLQTHFVKGVENIQSVVVAGESAGEGKQPERRVLAGTSGLAANVVVAKDGSGHYKSIGEAVKGAPSYISRRYVIYIKAGLYHENDVVVPEHKRNLAFVGDGKGKTVLTTSRGPPYSIKDSAALVVLGAGFFARDMTFENKGGPLKGQAVAMRSDADRSAFYRCSFFGFQDTLFANINRQFYKDCDIVGTIDFVFGDASVVFQNCNFFAQKPLPGQSNVIIAQGKENPNARGGTVLQNCRIAAYGNLGSTKSYLARPWHAYSTVIIMETKIDGFIDPAGFFTSQDTLGNERTSTFREYANTGEGSRTRNRVKWPSYKTIYSAGEAEQYTVANYINGNEWLPALGIPYKAGL